MPGAAQLEGPAEVTAWLEDVNVEYERVHREYEENFWSTKMALSGASAERLAATKTALDEWLASPARLAAVRERLARGDLSAEQRKVLQVLERTFGVYISEQPGAAELKEQLNQMEAALAGARNGMALGYTAPAADGGDGAGGEFKAASSVQLRNVMRVADDEATRRAAFEGLRSIGPFVAADFLKIVRARNKLAVLCGFQDFYDMKVTAAEGFGKAVLFEKLDALEEATRPLMQAARERLAKEKGAAALEPWNISQALAGDITKLTDPYFPFESAVDVWARTFAALGIKYEGSIMTLDLCDRPGKYSNGFCHWPQPAWRHADGRWVPAQTNFTSLATPNQVGSGKTALETLLHEGGHAAHFANVDQFSPLMSQERAPTSVAYAENQSMFLDSLAGDAAWLGRYARSRAGEVIPWALIEQQKRDTHPYEVFMLRAMLAVPYLEKELYERDLKAADAGGLTVEELLRLADEVEAKVQGGLSPRPLLSVPHILADESACYYHGYVLAEMSVHQTRDYFLSKYGSIVDNDKVGADLARVYWAPGNSAAFLDLVQQLTGAPLSADAWTAKLKLPVEELLAKERREYDAAVAAGPKLKPGDEVDIGMRVRLVDGDELISDSDADGGISGACQKFAAWVKAKFGV